MTAAALSGGRGAAGVRSPKGLLFIVTLLALVCGTKTLIDKNYLISCAHINLNVRTFQKIIQEYYEGGLEDAADKKKDFENKLNVASIIFEEELEKFHPMLDKVKAATSSSSSLKGLSSGTTDVLVKQRKDFAAGRKAHQEEIEDIWNFVQAQEYGED